MAPRPGPFHDRLSTAAAGAAPPALGVQPPFAAARQEPALGGVCARCLWELVAGDGRVGEVARRLVWELAQVWQRNDGVGTLLEEALSSSPLPAEGLWRPPAPWSLVSALRQTLRKGWGPRARGLYLARATF